MPIYEYRCDNGHLFEVMQKITDDPMTHCETCDAPVQRVFHPVAVHFKGSGFYNTDYGTARSRREREQRSASEGGGDKAGAKGDGKAKDTGSAAKSGDSKPASSTPAASS